MTCKEVVINICSIIFCIPCWRRCCNYFCEKCCSKKSPKKSNSVAPAGTRNLDSLNTSADRIPEMTRLEVPVLGAPLILPTQGAQPSMILPLPVSNGEATVHGTVPTESAGVPLGTVTVEILPLISERAIPDPATARTLSLLSLTAPLSPNPNLRESPDTASPLADSPNTGISPKPLLPGFHSDFKRRAEKKGQAETSIINTDTAPTSTPNQVVAPLSGNIQKPTWKPWNDTAMVFWMPQYSAAQSQPPLQDPSLVPPTGDQTSPFDGVEVPFARESSTILHL